MALIVCDSTPLIYLARLRRFDLLPRLHNPVMIPPAVWQEVAVQGLGLPESHDVQQGAAMGWLRVQPPSSPLNVPAEDAELLDEGESQAIQLAIERGACLAMDEAYGRRIAQQLGVRLTGTVGLLVRARRERMLPCLRAELDRLRFETSFRLSDAVYRVALHAADE